jgi:hypothetical protein
MGIAEILMKRDGMSKEDADDMVEEAREDLLERLDGGEMPLDICAEWFGLEPDYIDELLPL